MQKIKQIIEQPATLKLDDSTRVDTSLGAAIGVGTAAIFLTAAVIKNICNCYKHYTQMLANVERTTALLAELKSDQSANFQSIKNDIKNDFERINKAIHDLQISLNSSEHRIENMQKLLDFHSQKIELLEAVTNRIVGKLGDS